MPIRGRGVKVFRAKGRIYRYHRATGARILSDPNAEPERFIVEIRALDAKAAVQPAAPGTLGGLIRAYRASPEFAGLRPRTRADYNRVLDWLQPIEALPLARLDPAFVLVLRDRAYRPRPGKAKPRRRFANYVVQVMSAAAAWARPRGLLAVNPATEVPLIRRPKGAPRANRPWRADEFAAALNAAAAGVRLALLLGFLAGMREGDALTFPLAGYDGRAIRFRQSKTGEEVWMPAHAALRDALDRLRTEDEAKSAAGAAIVATTAVRNRSGLPYTQDGFRAVLFRMLRRLEAKGVVGPGLTFHGLRHTAGQALAEGDADTRTIAQFLGHRSESAARHYSDREDAGRRAAMAVATLERKKQ